MLTCGADIHSINTVRKHCSRLAGGRLALAASCRRIEVLAVSDVPGDSFSTIGSGPCAGDPTTYADALEVLDRFELRRRFPAELVRHFEAGKRGELPESPFPGDPALVGVHSEIVARNSAARAAAVAAARDRGERALDLGEVLAGEARVMGRRLAALARSLRCSTPTLLVAGGETVVRVTGGGRGGRSQELALAAALEWEREGRGGALAILAVGTDGADGPTDAAGAYVDAESPLRGTASTRAAEQHLSDHDSYGYFEEAGGLLRTGPTGTNVMDLVLIRVGSAGGVIDGV
jgi:glycerate-2-kinase